MEKSPYRSGVGQNQLDFDMAGAKGCASSVLRELESAIKNFGRFASAHEGIAVIREEYLELEAEVFKNQHRLRKEGKLEEIGIIRDNIRKEATQLAAMAIRLMIDCR